MIDRVSFRTDIYDSKARIGSLTPYAPDIVAASMEVTRIGIRGHRVPQQMRVSGCSLDSRQP